MIQSITIDVYTEIIGTFIKDFTEGERADVCSYLGSKDETIWRLDLGTGWNVFSKGVGWQAGGWQ